MILRSGSGTVAALAMLVTLALTGGCKRQRAPRVEEVWDAAPTDEMTDALSALAPAWPAPTRAILDSGLATFWLHEPDAPVFHARLLLPTAVGANEGPALAASAIVVHHIQQTLTRRLSALGVVVNVEHAPDRFEVAIAAHGQDGERVLQGIAAALTPRTSQAALLRAQQQVAQRARAVASEQAAIAELTAQLLNQPLTTQRLDPAAVLATDAEALSDAWRLVSDPRRAVLVVHAGQSATAMKQTLRTLSKTWHGLGRRELAASAVARLRAPGPPPAGSDRLLASPAAAITVAAGDPDGAPVLVMGRVIPTESREARSLARLAQRITAEDLDARIVIAGGRAVFLVRVTLSSRDPDGSATAAVDLLSQIAQTRQPEQRLFAAAQLWLGARVVQASLDGEDWTAMWSQAMDLADDDATIATALAGEAKAMLAPDADALKAWQQRWLDPRGGEPGWSWVVAGADDKQLRRLGRIAPITNSGG